MLWTRNIPVNLRFHPHLVPDLGIFNRILQRCKIGHLNVIQMTLHFHSGDGATDNVCG